MKQTPLAEIKERFGSKDELVKELKKLFDKGNLFENRLSADKGLAHVSNAKLLKLYDVAMEVKERFSTRDKLIDDLLRTLGRVKDEGLRARYERWGLPRLWDHYKGETRKRA
ncbi:MAG: hypothetical protein R6V85_07585 [Polyangia bacterium]